MHVSRLEMTGLAAYGETLEGYGETVYYLVSIDAEAASDPRVMAANLRMSPEAAPIALSQLDPGVTAKYLSPFVPPPQWPDQWKQKARQRDAYAGNGFHIEFKNGRLAYIGICSHCAGERASPLVGTPDGSRFFPLPLTEAELTAVFGQPSRIYPVGEVRY
jgi:hypothetical protein